MAYCNNPDCQGNGMHRLWVNGDDAWDVCPLVTVPVPIGPALYYCCSAACPGLPFKASEQRHPCPPSIDGAP